MQLKLPVLRQLVYSECVKGCSNGKLQCVGMYVVCIYKMFGECIVVGKLMELHSESAKTTTTEGGEKISRPDNYEPPVLDSV